MKRLVVLIVVATIVNLASGTGLSALHDSASSENRASSAAQYCTDLNPQTRLDVEQIMGLWYGSEVITHLGSEEGEIIYESCVVIHLTDTTNTSQIEIPGSRYEGPPVRFATDYGFSGDRDSNNRRHQNQQNQQQNYNYQWQQQQQNTRHLLLIWEEKEHTLEYKLRFNKSRAGFWMSSGPQEGTMVKLPYVHFTGTVQVLKAVKDQLVLTFCQSLPGSQLFTVVLSRQPMGLSPEENHSIRGLIRRRNLSTNSVRKVCYNGASSISHVPLTAAILVGFTTLILRATTLFK